MKRLTIRRDKGFTLVELLIVIVVIAILASIAVASYTGVIKRAEATAQLALIKQWTQHIDIAIANGETFSPGTSCLGSSAADFPEEGGVFVAGQCWHQNDSGYIGNVSYDAVALGALATQASSLNGQHALVERTDEGGSMYLVRGPYVRFFNTNSLKIRWVPVYAGECGPGYDEFGAWGDICAIGRDY